MVLHSPSQDICLETLGKYDSSAVVVLEVDNVIVYSLILDHNAIYFVNGTIMLDA